MDEDIMLNVVIVGLGKTIKTPRKFVVEARSYWELPFYDLPDAVAKLAVHMANTCGSGEYSITVSKIDQ